MKTRTYNILLHLIGIIAILTAVFIWFWLGTIGLYITLYDWGMNRDVSSFFMMAIGIIIGGFVFKIGIGIIKRRNWSRRALVVFWSIVSALIIGFILLNIRDSVVAHAAYFTIWLQEVLVWSAVAIMGILHVVFLRSSKVKELFKNKRDKEP